MKLTRRAFLLAPLAAFVTTENTHAMAATEPAGTPAWDGSHANSKDWDNPILGEAKLPGFWSVQGLKLAIEVQTKKAKGSDQPTSKDLGSESSKFKLVGEMNTSHLAAYEGVLTQINPRRPGRERAPVGIIHPLVNLHGIVAVRILSIDTDQPKAGKPWVVTIHLEEWFDAPKETKNVKKLQPPAGRGSMTNREAANVLLADKLARDAIERNRRDGLKNLSAMPDNPETVMDSFNDDDLGAGGGRGF
jgi:hypothetical protein